MYLNFEPYNTYLYNNDEFIIYYPYVIQLFESNKYIYMNEVIDTNYINCIKELVDIYNESQINYCKFLTEIKTILITTNIDDLIKQQLMNINIQPLLYDVNKFTNNCVIHYLNDMRKNIDLSEETIMEFYDVINFSYPQ